MEDIVQQLQVPIFLVFAIKCTIVFKILTLQFHSIKLWDKQLISLVELSLLVMSVLLVVTVLQDQNSHSHAQLAIITNMY